MHILEFVYDMLVSDVSVYPFIVVLVVTKVS